MGGHSLLQGIFPTQGLNQGLLLLLCRQVGSLPLQRGLMGQNPGALNAVTKDQVLHWLWFPDGDTSHSYPGWVVWESKK